MSLTLEHLDDLRRSGLSDATILACQFEAVRPQDITLRGVNSAYRLKYFDLAGRPNCAERWKLFPALTGLNGTQKYHQAPGTSPALYMPPLLSWDEVARGAHIPLVITEGEKKAAAACQRGLVTLGIAGVWNWRQQLDSGERLTLSALDQFVWPGRSVLLGSDSDAWRADKLLTVLSGFYALGQELISRGATVRMVRIPERAGVKVGLDDWLMAVGDLWETEWAALERVSLDALQLASVARWWQGWREKDATRAAIQKQADQELTITETAGIYTVDCPAQSVRFLFERLADQRGGITAEASVTLGGTELLSAVNIGLKSDTSQKKLSDSLKVSAPHIAWKFLLQRACALVKQHHRIGEPVKILSRHSEVVPLSFVINPLVYQRKISVLYGDGGKGKSTLALFLAMLASTGQSVAGLRALPGRPLYLDYEDDDDIHTLRLHALIAGHPELTDAEVRYQRCAQPLAVIAPQLLHRIRHESLDLLVIDSLFAAAGGAEAEQCNRFFAALRPLKVAAVVLAHIPKPQDGVDPSIYGSIFNKNFARSTWEFRAEPSSPGGPRRLGLYNRKINYGPDQSALGLQIYQAPDHSSFRYEACDLSEADELAKGLPAASQIRNLLDRDGTPRTAKEISDDTGLPLSTVKSTLSREQGRKWHKIMDGRETKWTVLGAGK